MKSFKRISLNTLLCGFILIINMTISQTQTILTLENKRYKYEEKLYNYTQLESILSTNEKAFMLYNESRRAKNKAIILGGIGILSATGGIIFLANAEDCSKDDFLCGFNDALPGSVLFLSGIALQLRAMVISFDISKKKKKSINVFNEAQIFNNERETGSFYFDVRPMSLGVTWKF